MAASTLIFFVLGTICATVSGIFLCTWGLSRKSLLWQAARLLYVILGCFELYMGTIYGLVLFGLLPIAGYGAFIRPVAFISYLAPFLIALINRRQFGRIL
jgi:uncharacterized membrane protein